MLGGRVLRLKCLLSGTIHIAVGCHRFNVVVRVEQWVISSQEKEFISELKSKGQFTQNYTQITKTKKWYAKSRKMVYFLSCLHNIIK